VKNAVSPDRPAATATAAPGGTRRRPRRRWLAVAVVVVILIAGVAVAVGVGAFGKNGSPSAGAAGSGYATSVFAVRRESLTSQSQQDATLGDAGAYTVVVPQSSSSSSGSSGSGSGSGSGSSGSASGTFTWLPQVGQTIRQGQRIYAVSGSPVVLLYGSVPAYRDLYEGLTGSDVTELSRDLVKLGFTTAAALGPRSGWDYYSAATAYGVEQLQTHWGLAVTGELSLGEAVFQPGPVLVTALGTTSLGAAATAGTVVLTGTSVTPQVVIALDAGNEGVVKVGDAVSVTLPDGSITPGKVTQVATVATSSSSSAGSGSSGGSPDGSSGGAPGSSGGAGTATVNVYVSLTHPGAARKLSQAPVTVTITESSVADALVVPVDALLAQPHGRYAVEVTTGHGHHLVTVTPGLFDDAAGLVQVSGNLAPGQRVVVPGI
jgi:uncharacterized membrane protein YgcG